MDKRIKLMIMILCVCLGVTGCWDAVEIEEKDIITTVIVDRIDNGYAFTAEVASIAQGGDQQGSAKVPKSKVIKGEGHTFIEAREEVERQSDRLIDLSEVQCVAFTENILYDSIEQYMQRFRQNPEYRKTVFVAGTPENPDDLLKASTENNTIIGSSINDTLESLVKNGQMYEMTMGDVLTSMSCEYRGYLIPAIGLRGNEITLIGFYAMDGGLCKGFVPVYGSSGIVHFHTRTKPAHYNIQFEDMEVALEVDLKSPIIKAEYTDGQVRFHIRLSCVATLLYLSKETRVTDEMLLKMGEALKQDLQKRHIDAVKTSQQIGVDYLDLHETFRIKYPDIYANIDWSEVYPKAEINFDTNVLVKWGTVDYKSNESE